MAVRTHRRGSPGKRWPHKISKSRDKNDSPIKTSHEIMSPRTRTLILSQRTLNFKLNNELRQLNEPRTVLLGILLASKRNRFSELRYVQGPECRN